MTDPLSAGSFADFVAAYNPPPEDVDDHSAHVEKIRAARAATAQKSAGLLNDLRTAGFDVTKVAELREPGVGDPRAVPILLDWLPRIGHRPTEREIAKTLTEAWARKQALQPLLDQFQAIEPDIDPEDGLRWVIAEAIERICDDTVAQDLLAIAQDRNHGAARAMIVLALGRMRKHRSKAIPVLLDLLADPTVAYAAIEALGKLKAVQARAQIEPFVRDPDPWVRNKANRALAKLPLN